MRLLDHRTLGAAAPLLRRRLADCINISSDEDEATTTCTIACSASATGDRIVLLLVALSTMHGRKRDEYKAKTRDPIVAKALADKAKKWYAVQDELLLVDKRLGGNDGGGDDYDNSEDGDGSGESRRQKLLAVTYQLLTVNPDPLWLWTRRRQLLAAFTTGNGAAAADSASSSLSSPPSSFLTTELELTQYALQNGNPKSYGAWLHRKWALQRYLVGRSSSSSSDYAKKGNEEAQTILINELKLIAQLLSSDERNFHGWSYRRFIVSCQLSAVQAHQKHLRHNSSAASACASFDGSWSTPNIGFAGGERENVWMGAQVIGQNKNEQKQKQQSQGAEQGEEEEEAPTTPTVSAATIQEVQKIVQHELDFSLSKINDNFSNFSAFHYRSKLLPITRDCLNCIHRLNTADSADADVSESMVDRDWLDRTLNAELDLVESAIFTEPDDQTAWWYQRFLLDFSSAASASGAPQQRQRLTKGTGDDDGDGLRNEERWRTHLGNLRELVQDEENCKWAWLGILQVLDRISGTTGGNGEEEESNKKNERRSILGKLIIIDPHRKERYKQMLSRY